MFSDHSEFVRSATASERFEAKIERLFATHEFDLGEAAGWERLRRFVLGQQYGSGTEVLLLGCVAGFLTNRGTSTMFGLGELEARAGNEVGRIYAQRRVGPYRPDILVDCDFLNLMDPLRIVIECDGPWHDKAANYHHDKKRDRWMLAEGFTVLRFTTNEITSRGGDGAFNCAVEVGEVIQAHQERELYLAGRRAAFSLNALGIRPVIPNPGELGTLESGLSKAD